MVKKTIKMFFLTSVTLVLMMIMLLGCVYTDPEVTEKRDVNQEEMIKEKEAKDEAKAEQEAKAKEEKAAEEKLQAERKQEQADAIAEMNASRVNLQEFEAIHEGMSKDQVVDLIGGPLELLSSAGNAEMYMAEGVGQAGANANFTFVDGKLYAKAQFGLE